jgi:hypothetical protein
MRRYAFRWVCVAAGFLLLGIPLSGQAGTEKTSPADQSNVPSNGQTHLGYPQDWSSRHLLMPGMRAENVLAAGDRDPRYVYNMVMRQVAMERFRPRRHRPQPQPPMRIDWAVSLENGYVPTNQSPAKYQFDVVADSCSSDYVVFGLNVTSGTQANLVGINNLYTGATLLCNSGSPWVSFAYNTVTQSGGQINTSPALSTDGTKVAFVESTSGGSYFHVLVLPNPIPVPPSQAGTVLVPQTPTSCTTPTTAGCMTSLTIETAATNSNSSPWVDYNTDTAYVGADNGLLYKITPVFGGGAPALVSTGGWPVTVSTQATKVLTAPVVDDTAGLIFVGDGEGYLYSVSLASPGGTYSAQQTIGWAGHGAGTGIVDPPIAVTDPANSTTDQVFAFTGCSYVLGIGGAITQLPANFTTGVPTTSNTVDLGSATGGGDCTGKNVHAGTFDNAFWVSGSTSGHMIACGFVDKRRHTGGTADVYVSVREQRHHEHRRHNLFDRHHAGRRVFAADRVLQRYDGPDVFRSGVNRRIPEEFDDYPRWDTANLDADHVHGRSTDIQLRHNPERSRRNQRDRDRQPIVERRDEPLLLDHRARVCERADVQCIGRNCQSLLCREADPVSFAVRGLRFEQSFSRCRRLVVRYLALDYEIPAYRIYVIGTGNASAGKGTTDTRCRDQTAEVCWFSRKWRSRVLRQCRSRSSERGFSRHQGLSVQ